MGPFELFEPLYEMGGDIRDPGGGGGGGGGQPAPPPPGQSGPGSGQVGQGGAAPQAVGPTPAAPLPFSGWIGAFIGRNDKVPPTAVSEFECDEIENLLISALTLDVRGGQTAILDTLTAASWTPHGVHRNYNLGTSAYSYIAGDFDGTNRIKTSRTGAWTDAFTPYTVGVDGRVEFVPIGTAVYVLFGSSAQVAQKVTGADVFANVAWAPAIRPSMGVWHKKRLWVDDVDNRGRIWLSDTNAPDTMRSQTDSAIATEGGFIDFALPAGDNVRGLMSFGQFLLVFSERSIQFVSGTNFSNFVINPAFGLGTKSPRSLQLAENDAWFLSSDKKVRFISGSQPNINATVHTGYPGYYIEPLTEAIPDDRQVQISSAYQNRRYWLFYTS